MPVCSTTVYAGFEIKERIYMYKELFEYLKKSIEKAKTDAFSGKIVFTLNFQKGDFSNLNIHHTQTVHKKNIKKPVDKKEKFLNC